jgi:hypothetical protein
MSRKTTTTTEEAEDRLDLLATETEPIADALRTLARLSMSESIAVRGAALAALLVMEDHVRDLRSELARIIRELAHTAQGEMAAAFAAAVDAETVDAPRPGRGQPRKSSARPTTEGRGRAKGTRRTGRK